MKPRFASALSLMLAAALFAPATGAAAILPMTDAMAVMDVVKDHIVRPDDFDISIVAEVPYAITFWKAAGGRPGGTALLEKSAGEWHLVKLQASPFGDAGTLQRLGVPPVQARALIADLAKANAP